MSKLPDKARPVHDGRQPLGFITISAANVTAWTNSGRRLGEYKDRVSAIAELKRELILEGARAS